MYRGSEKQKAARRRYYQKHRVRLLAEQKTNKLWRRRDPAAIRRRRGLPEPTRPETDVCECCGAMRGARRLHLDHDHNTGAFRGWLCSNCNTGIGKCGDSIEGLQRAIRYLEGANSVSSARIAKQ